MEYDLNLTIYGVGTFFINKDDFAFIDDDYGVYVETSYDHFDFDEFIRDVLDCLEDISYEHYANVNILQADEAGFNLILAKVLALRNQLYH